MSSTPYVLKLENARDRLVNEKRVAWQPLLQVTQRRKGTKWNHPSVKLTLPAQYEGQEVKCGLGEEEATRKHVHVSVSKLLWLAAPPVRKGEAPSASRSEHGWLSAVVRDGEAIFQITPAMRAQNAQVTRPQFVIFFVVKNEVVALTERFHARSRWGISPKETEDVFRRIESLGRPVYNKDLIRQIDTIKAPWRNQKDLQFKLEKASWLQFRLVDDPRVGLTLVQRCRDYHRTPKFEATEDVAREVQAELDALTSSSSSSSSLPAAAADSNNNAPFSIEAEEPAITSFLLSESGLDFDSLDLQTLLLLASNNDKSAPLTTSGGPSDLLEPGLEGAKTSNFSRVLGQVDFVLDMEHLSSAPGSTPPSRRRPRPQELLEDESEPPVQRQRVELPTDVLAPREQQQVAYSATSLDMQGSLQASLDDLDVDSFMEILSSVDVNTLSSCSE